MFVFNQDMTVREPTERDWEEKEKEQPGFKEYAESVRMATENVMTGRNAQNN
jgi:hypothetical protein